MNIDIDIAIVVSIRVLLHGRKCYVSVHKVSLPTDFKLKVFGSCYLKCYL